MKRTIKTLLVAGVVGSAAVLAGAYSGIVNVGADDPHFSPLTAFLSLVRDRSIEVRSQDIEVPDLRGQALIRSGAGNYNSMCVGCHLGPGVAPTELSKSLYPAPPNLGKIGIGNSPEKAFWVIKHGIKASGMPAWGKNMDDQYIWNMVAFMAVLPDLDAKQYQALVASSAGHSHGGGETPANASTGEGHHGAGESAAPGHHGSATASEGHHVVPTVGEHSSHSPTTPSKHADSNEHSH
jgi:mono/diheme cytochrome c family protein